MKTFIVYTRVSTLGQEKGYSIQEQIDLGKKKAYELGATSDNEIFVYTDVETGAFLNRAALMDVFKQIEEEEIDYFICYDPDRLSREAVNALVAHEMIEKHGTEIVYINTNYNKTPEGKLFFQMKVAIAEYEKEKIKARTMLGKLGKAKRRLLTHNPGLYGYDYDAVTDKLSINEEEKKVILMMVNWIFEDDSIGMERIANRLNDMNILPPKGKITKKKKGRNEYSKEDGIWYKTTVKRILNNYTYTGTLFIQKWDTVGTKYNKYREDKDKIKRRLKPQDEWIAVDVPQIIPVEIWEELQSKLQQRRNLNPGIAKENYLLRGLLRCGLCDSTLHGNRVVKKDKVHKYYVCTAKSPGIRNKDKCTLPNIKGEQLDNVVWEVVKGWILNPDTIKSIIETDSNNELLFKERNTLNKKVEELNEEQERLEFMYMKGRIDDKKYEKYDDDIRQNKSGIISRLKEIDKELEYKNLNIDDINQFVNVLDEYKEIIDDIEYEDKQRLINIFVSKIIVNGKDDIVIHGKIPTEKLETSNHTLESSYLCPTFTFPITI